LVLSAALFGLAVAVEHGANGDSHIPSAQAGPSAGTETGNEGSESNQAGEPAGRNARHAETPASERVFGVGAESPITLIAMVVVSLLLAAAVLRYRRRPVFAVVAVFGSGASALDIAEVVRQFDAGRFAIGALAVLIAALHLAVLAGALALIRRPARGFRTRDARVSVRGVTWVARRLTFELG
jgi:hypothetical protein